MSPRWIAPIVTWLASDRVGRTSPGACSRRRVECSSVAEGWHRGPARRAGRRPHAHGAGRRRPPGQGPPERRHGRRRRQQLRQETTMPINPDAVGTKSEPVETSWTSKDCPALRRRRGCRRRTSWRSPPRTPPACRSRCSRPWPSCSAWAARSVRQDRHLQPGDARARRAGHRAAPADPARGNGQHHERDHRHLRQGQGRGGRDRVEVGRRDDRRAAVHDAHRRRSSAARAAGAATVAPAAR